MNFDQPEAQLFFGHQNHQTCSYCRWRQGRSCFRRGKNPLSSHTVKRLYSFAQNPKSPFRDEARQKLRRWGFNFDRRCCLLDFVDDELLVRIPGRDDVYPCLDFRDTLHGVMMFLQRTLMDTIDYIPFEPAQRRLLDLRLRRLGANKCLRDCWGTCFRTQASVFNDAHMTAADKICWVFFLPHVFGAEPDSVLPGPQFHAPLMYAVSKAQLIMIAVRGLRSYSVSELKDIFDLGYREFFGALQSLTNMSYDFLLQRHEHKPKKYAKPAKLAEKPPKRDDESETDDTDNELDLGGYDFSHGKLALIHQHWVIQVITAGSFFVHCTQSAEAAHKDSAKLAASRARHTQVLTTLQRMTKYLTRHVVFEHLKPYFPSLAPSSERVSSQPFGVWTPLFNRDGSAVEMDTGYPYTSALFQTRFLHEEVLVTRGELMDLLCDTLHLPKSLDTYKKFSGLDFEFGQKLTRADGHTFWGTDSQYGYEDSDGRRSRRDKVLVEGTVKCTYRLDDGRRVERVNALCAEITCFVVVSHLSLLPLPWLQPVGEDPLDPVFEELRSFVHNDSMILTLVRWFEPHELSRERDNKHRPICPWPLNINHCLWKRAKTPAPRKMLFRHKNTTRVFTTQRHRFGDTQEVQDATFNDQKNAYYGLVFPQNIVNKVNMSPCFVHGSVSTGCSWLETVTVLSCT